MIRDKGQSEKLEIIKRSLLEDSKNRKKYLKIRSEKGLINEKNAKERYLFSERTIISNKEGETMTEKPNTVVTTEEIKAKKEPELKEKKVVLSDAAKAKEKERLAKEKEKAKEKERLAKEKAKAKEKERLAKEKAKAKEKERLAKEKAKAKEKERLAKEKEKAKEKERLAKEKEKAKEKERLAKEKEKAKEKELLDKEKEEPAKTEKIIKEDLELQEEVEKEKQEKLDIQEKMRRKIEAQKLLDQGFIKSEAEKTQSKEMDLKEKMSKLEVNYEESYDDQLNKELEDAYGKIDSLMQENQKMKEMIAEADKNVNKLSKQLTAITQEKKELQKTKQNLEKKLTAINKEKEDLLSKSNDLNKQFTELNEELNNQKDELKKANLVIEELRQELTKKEQATQVVDKNDYEQTEAELLEQKKLYEETAKKVVELETQNQELIKNIEEIREDSASKLAEKETELVTQQNSYEEAKNKIAELEAEKQEIEKTNHLLTEQKTKLQESLNDAKQKKATLLSIKYNDIFVLDKSGEDISSELEAYLETLKKANEENVNELNDVKAKLLAKDEFIATLEKENSELKVLGQKPVTEEPTLFDEKVKVEDKYDVEAEIKKIKDEILQIKKREISILEDNDQKYVMNKNQDMYQRIHNLEQEIYQKDQQLQLIRQQFNDINEEKIIDPEFKRKIRRVRNIKKELNESFEEEKKFINRSIIQVEQQINQKKIEVANAKEKVETIEKEYAGQTDRTSLGRESYLSKRGKALIELELFEDRLQKLSGELVDLKERYDYLVQCYDERVEQLNQSEKEIIDYYLNEMKSDLIGKDKAYSVKNEEREDLIRQLNELNQAQQQTQTALWQNNQVISKALETNREIKEQILSDKKQNIDQGIRRLENEIQEKNTMCNNLTSLLGTVNLKYGERINAEKQIRMTDETVVNYLKIAGDNEDLTQEYHDNLNQTQEVTEKIDALANNPDQKSEVLRLRAKLEDLDILKSDLIAKIEFSRKKMENLRNNEKVLYYTRLIESIKELKNKQEELKLNIEKLKTEISEKNAELERTKEEKFKLE